MSKKMKRSEKDRPANRDRPPGAAAEKKLSGNVQDSSRPLVTGISRSVADLLDRTKAYLSTGKKAKA